MAAIVKDETVEEKLQSVLEDLKKSDLKKFKWHLTDIPKGKLETNIPHEIVDILIDKYQPIGSLEVTVKTLKKMNQNNLAKELAAFKASMPDSINQDVMGKTALNCQKELKQILIEENLNGDKGNALNQILDIYLTDEGDDSDQNERSDTENTSRVIPLTTIFDPLPERQSPPRLVLSKGVAGIGKTIAIRKFTLDWAEDKSNHDIQFVFPFFFRELNVIKKDHSFNELIHMFYPRTKHYGLDYNKFKVLIILEGLDEYSCSSFNFHATCRDLTVHVPVKQLLTGLIKGCLLPKALVWITTRPEAVVHIPEQCIDRVTAFQGFSDAQKEEFFRMNIHDEGFSESVIKHIKTTPFLHTLCNIPVYCVMAARVLGRMMVDKDDREFPKTVTELYIYYLVEELKRNILQRSGNHDIDLKSYQNVVMSLGKIAYKKLRDGKVSFSQEDLKDCGIDLQTDQLKMCQHIFKKGKDGYAFEHLSIQEFLAALYAFLSFHNGEGDVINLSCKDKATALLNKKSSGFLKRTVNTVLEDRRGNMYNFLRFFLGLTLESNQTCLGDLMQENDRKSEKKSKEKIVDHIKKTIRKTASPETCVSLFYCLAELQEQSLVEEIKSSFISSNRVTRKKFTPEQLSAITFVASTSEDLDLGDFNLKDYQQSSGPGLKPRPSTSKLEDSLLRLLPVIKLSAKANLGSCGLTWRSCEGLASILECPLSSLRELNLCCNRNLQDSGVKRLCKGLENQDCKLEILRLADCGLNDKGFKYLALALKKNPPHLKELDLGQNYPGIDGVEMIASTLKDPECKLEILKMWCCGINEDGFGSLASALMANPSYIRELDLNRNSPGDEGLKRLAEVLEHTECKLEKLCVSHEKRIQYDMGLDDMVRCETTGKSCEVLASALMANPFHLKVLDLGGSNLKDLPEAQLLVALAEDPQNCLAELKL